MSGFFPENEKSSVLAEFPTLKDAFTFFRMTHVSRRCGFLPGELIISDLPGSFTDDAGFMRSCKSDVESHINSDVELCEARVTRREIAYVGDWNRYQIFNLILISPAFRNVVRRIFIPENMNNASDATPSGTNSVDTVVPLHTYEIFGCTTCFRMTRT